MKSANIPLAHKHRPTRFDRLRGQDRAVAILSGFVRARAPIHVLLFGAYGAGKSTLAGLYAKALLCKRPDVDGSPCNSCSCSDPRNFLEFDVPKEGDSPGYLLELINLRMRNCTDRPVIFLDEAHALHKSDADALLKRLEDVRSSATYILATTAPWEISSALRSRLHRVEVEVLSPWDSVRFLEEVAEAEGLALDERALRLIAALSKGHPRDLLTNLDTVVDRRSGSHQRISDAQVRARLGLASDDFLLSYFRALVNEGADAATVILHNWPASWSSKSRWVQAFLLALEQTLRHFNSYVDPLVDVIDDDIRQEVLEGFRRLWKLSDTRELRDYWPSLIKIWSGSRCVSEVEIRLRFAGFGAAVEEPLLLRPRSNETIAQPELVPYRPSADSAVGEDQPDALYAATRSLDFGHVREIIHRASCFVQGRGAPFNIMLTYFPPHDDREDTARAVRSIEHFVKRLLAFDDSNTSPQAVICVLARDGAGVFGRIAGRLRGPAALTDCYAKTLDWFEKNKYFVEQSSFYIDDNRSTLKFHWRTVGSLCASLPEMEWPNELKRVFFPGRIYISGPIPSVQPIVQFYGGVSSAALRTNAEPQLPYLSAVQDGAWPHVIAGWELDESRDRLRLRSDRLQQLEKLSKTSHQDDTAARAKLFDSWMDDHRRRSRSWPTWF